MIDTIISTLVGLAVSIGGLFGITTEQPKLGAFGDPFVSVQLAPDPNPGNCLTTDGTENAWATCASGGGGSGGGTWSTTTSTVSGQLNNYPNNSATDVVVIGSTATTTAEFFFDPKAAGPFAKIGSQLLVTGSTTLQNFTGLRSTTSQATTTNLAITSLTSELLKVDGNGTVLEAVSGTDYEVPLTFGDGLTRTANDVDVDTTQNITNLSNLTSNGFVKTSGGNGTLSVDTTTYESGLTAGDGLTRTANDFDCDTASGSVFGCLSAANWTTFNNKQDTITAGDALTLTGTDIDFDGGATPSGDLGGTWASPSVTDDSHAHTGTTLSGIDISSDTNLTGDSEIVLTGDALSIASTITRDTELSGYVPTSRELTINGTTYDLSANRSWTVSGGGTGNVATSSAETAGQLPYWTSTNGTPATLGGVATTSVTCTGDASCTPFTVIGSSPITISSSGGAGGSWATTSEQYYWSQFRDWSVVSGTLRPTTTTGIVIGASSTISALTVTSGTTTNATSTNLHVSGTADIGTLSGVLIGTSGVVSAGVDGTDYTLVNAVSCTNQVVTALTAAGVGTCTSVSNAMLSNSSVSYGGVSVSLGGSDASPAFNLIDATGLPISTGVSGLGTSVATALGVNVGTAGSFVVNGGALGTPSSGTLTNATGLPIVAGTTGTLTVARGGTGLTTFGGTNTILYTTAADTLSSEAAFTYNPSTNTITADSFLANASSTFPNFTAVNSTTTNATTTNFSATTICISGDCKTAWPASGSGAYPFAGAGNSTSTLTQFNAGLTSYASTTIGNGNQNGGLTINGGATTTGNFIIGTGSTVHSIDGSTRRIGVATSSPFTTLSVGGAAYVGGNFTATGTIQFTNISGSTQCLQVDSSGNVTGAGSACGSGSGGSNSKFATSSDSMAVYPNGGIDIGLGIGTTTPHKLSDLNVASTSPAFILSDTNGTTNSKHFGIFFNDGKMYFATTSDAQTATSSAGLTYDPVGAAAFGLGTSTPFYKFSIGSGNGSSSASILVAEHQPATSTSMTIDWTNGNQQMVRLGNAATTISFSNYTDGATLKVIACNPPTGTAGTITWGTQVLWAGGSAPSQTTTAQKCDVWSFLGTQATSTLKVFGSVTNSF